ncbi:GGDEF domain-containing protein [Nodosilinea sp. LEGE 07088]|uniref:sensor domain-containing diguanylate cyclase n=1 Tax=Nodosilinea sp. LEGE 07088 TaxID=2777968 RepID=UPI00188279B5|nr:GGDEF domain-containing protein [Nodosilinea sp. LEGE 07088]MBE9139000.1 GGDEF domain-containing protein [Nodosilinea sp. LEGE 07088]
MTRVQPATLGDAYPALCNFLRLTSLTLAVTQLAMTVQMGDDWRNGGLMNYGQLPLNTLRELLLSQPIAGTTRNHDQLSLGTYSRAPSHPEATVLVGRLHSATVRYQLRIYVPGLAVDQLSEAQVQTLRYLSQLLLLCLTLIPPLGPALQSVPSPDLPIIAPVRPDDFLSRVEALSAVDPTHDPLHQGHRHLVDLVAQLQSCLSYKQLGQLLATYLPRFCPHQAGRLVLLARSAEGSSESFTVLTAWGDTAALRAVEQRCGYDPGRLSSQSPRVGQKRRQGQVTNCPQQDILCIVLGTINDTTCALHLVQMQAASGNPGQTKLLKQLSEQILFVIQRLLLLEDLQDKALKDPLTGLLNRRHAETVLDGLCQAGQQNISIILIDIDHFKAINDTYGHQAGDAVLQNMGMLLRGYVRSQDIVYRYGGEEFCMMLLDTTPEVAIRRAEKIRRAVKYINTSFNGQVLPPLTISLGVAGFPHHGDTPQALISLADKALYRAKNSGRDRTVSVDQMLASAEPRGS